MRFLQSLVVATLICRAKSSSALQPFSANGADLSIAATSPRGARRSFAAASFASFTPTSETKLPATGTSAKWIPQARSSNDENRQKPYTPEQVVELAQSLSSPVAMPAGGFKGAELKRRKSAGASFRRGSSVSPDKPPLALEPVEYQQLDEVTLLPYVDRPAEVAELVGHPSNDRLFKLLKAAFPKEPMRQHWKALPPADWYWDEFINHLTKQSRVDCPDYAWVFRARQAVRARSVALWEKLGICLGCDPDLLNAGGEDGLPPSWGGLGLGEEGEYDPTFNYVHVEGLEAVDPEEQRRAERQFRESFGNIVEDEGEQAAAGMTALLGTIGENEGEEGAPVIRDSSARNPLLVDPINELDADANKPRDRSKSFVGLQILCSPSHPTVDLQSPLVSPRMGQAALPVFERGPGSPLFPSSFSSLSLEPNLGRSASVGIGGGVRAAPADFGRSNHKRWSKVERKQSATGLSESESNVFGIIRETDERCHNVRE